MSAYCDFDVHGHQTAGIRVCATLGYRRLDWTERAGEVHWYEWEIDSANYESTLVRLPGLRDALLSSLPTRFHKRLSSVFDKAAVKAALRVEQLKQILIAEVP